ncbi:MAG: DegT/DnrJ/EryC1/StrS family aminotransferase [Proteobacteria bacterium]|nr:DegT/DnrJ/EryC1/StrS family aminotransferase [Pseudomonadota bacterium]
MIKFNGIDKIYDSYSWRITRKAKEVWKSGNVVSTKHSEDSYLDKFEKSVAKYTKRRFGIAVGSGTDALYFALRAKGIGPGKTVLCPAISYLATAEAIKRTGASIKFVDVNENGLIGDIGISVIPDAVVYVNIFGNLADYNRLAEYCKEHRIPLIEDAAQSLGSSYHGIPSGKLGDISILSFSPSKPLPCFGNGGMVLTDNENETDLIRSMRYHGAGTAKLHHGYNSCLSNDHANVLNFLLSKYKKLLNKTNKIQKLYNEKLSRVGISSIQTQSKTVSNNHKFVIKVQDRDNLKAYLETKNIQSQVHYVLPLSKMKMFYTDDKMPNAERFSQEVLSLPIHPFLEDYEVSYVCKCIGDFYGV